MKRVLSIIGWVGTLGIHAAFVGGGIARANDWPTCYQRLAILTGAAALPRELDARFIRDRSVSPRLNQRAQTAAYLRHLAEKLELPVRLQTWHADPSLIPESWVGKAFDALAQQQAIVYQNVVVDIAGTDPSRENQIVVIGAHYDVQNNRSKLWRGGGGFKFEVTPGADDNGSGVVAATALMDRLAKNPLKHPVRIVFFDAEEPGKFNEGIHGSAHYVAELSETELAKIRLSLILDMVGAVPQSPSQAMNLSVSNSAARLLPPVLARGGLVNAGELPWLVVPETSPAFLGAYADTLPFLRAEIPSALITNVTTIQNLPRHYHTRKDDLSVIDGPQMMKVIQFVETWLRTGQEVP